MSFHLSLAALILARGSYANLVDEQCGGSVGDLFSVFIDTVSFFDAADACKNRGQSLATIATTEDFDFVHDLTTDYDLDFWIGILDPTLSPTSNGTERFVFLDDAENQNQQSLDFIHVPIGSFPWNDFEPNNDGGTEGCVELWPTITLFNDQSCDSELAFICRGSCTTAIPSLSPTRSRTRRPNATPTRQPSPNPTVEPTAIPTKKPTPIPTRKPTPIPTKQPTLAPTTKSPTLFPTANPIESPTVMPTEKPSESLQPANDISKVAKYTVGGFWILSFGGLMAVLFRLKMRSDRLNQVTQALETEGEDELPPPLGVLSYEDY